MQFGLAGSPTTVIDLHPVESQRLGRIIEAESLHQAAAELAHILVHEHGLFGRWNVKEQPAIAQVVSATQRTGPSDVWVFAEELGGSFRPVVFELLGKARELAGALRSQVIAVLLGHGNQGRTQQLATHGADRVLLCDDPRLTPFHVETYAGVLTKAIELLRPGIVLLGATSCGRELAPRVAARLQLGLTADCVDIGLDEKGRLLQYKPAFGGSIVAPIVSRTFPEMATVRPGMLAACTADARRHAEIEPLLADGIGEPRTRILSHRREAEGAVDLDRAEVVIGVGKGLGEKAKIESLRALVHLLGAALCTTRDVTDAGWLSKQYQVGLTGRAISPKLYIAIGVRGAFEHMVGVRRAGLVVAINKSPKAPIFKSADYGIVGDHAEVVPALERALAALRPGAATG